MSEPPIVVVPPCSLAMPVDSSVSCASAASLTCAPASLTCERPSSVSDVDPSSATEPTSEPHRAGPDPAPGPSWEEPDPAHGCSPASFDDGRERLPSGDWQAAHTGSPPFEEDDDCDQDDDEHAWQAENELGPPCYGEPHSNGRHAPSGWGGSEAQGSVAVIDSPALAQLRDKLRGFEMLLMRGELDKAAVIARDVQAILDDFDPLVYLPALFARYTQLLHAVYGELEVRWQQSEHPNMQVLAQFYRSNLAGFLDESP